MLDIKFIRDNPEQVRQAILNRGVRVDTAQLVELDSDRRRIVTELDNLRKEQNEISEALSKQRTTAGLDRARILKENVKSLESKLEECEREIHDIMTALPNIPLENVPIGKDEKNNVVVREWGKKLKFDFQPRDYLEIAQSFEGIDTERAGNVSGTRFGYIKGKLAQMEFALIMLAFDTLVKEKFTPIIPPVFIKPEPMWGMGYIDSPADREERYFFEKDNLYLVGTSEQSVGPMHRNEIFNDKDLPRRYAAFSTCFRREAGSYGKDTRGILRVHQFDKVEMFSYASPDESKKEHEFFLHMEEKLMQLLQIPYRVVQLCTGDLSKPSAATFDIEAWLPGQNQYRETHSCSNTTDFQARRLNIRHKTPSGKNQFVHMLNGTAFAIGRMLIAIIENYQTKQGTVNVPKALRKYLSFKEIP